MATATTFEPAWRLTATTTVAAGSSISAHPEPHLDALVLDRVFHLGDVVEIHGSAVGAADDQISVRLRGVQLAVGPKQRGSRRAVKLPRARIAGAVFHGGHQIVDRNSARPHLGGIDLDAHGGLRAEHVHAAHAGQNADSLAHLRASVIVELAGRDRIAGERDVQNRLVVRIRLGIRGRRRQIRGKAAGGLRDGCLHVGGGRVDALVQRELQREAHVALRALRGHQLQSVDLHELPLERRGDIVGDGVRARARIICLHGNDRIVHHRQIVHRKAQITEHAENDHGDGQDRRHDRPANEWFGKIHDCPAAGAGAAAPVTTRTLPPGITPSWPLMTTRSPALQPLLDDHHIPLPLPELHGPQFGGRVLL